MKPSVFQQVCAAWFLGVSVLPLHAGLELSGVAADRTETLFSLIDTDSQTRSGWLRLGQTFEGSTLVRYDQDKGTLWVDHSGESVALTLRAATITESFETKLERIAAQEKSGGLTPEQADAERRAAGAVSIAVFGLVNQPGKLWTRSTVTLSDVIKAAGGFGRTAFRSRIKLTRTEAETGVKKTYVFDINSVNENGQHPWLSFALQDNDIIFVPETIF